VTGRVDAVVPARKGGKPGTIDVSFTQLRLPNGLSRRINGSLTDLDTDDAKSTESKTTLQMHTGTGQGLAGRSAEQRSGPPSGSTCFPRRLKSIARSTGSMSE